MQKCDAIDYFGTGVGVALALGISQQAVHKWPEQVPKGSSAQLHILTDGKLVHDPEDYIGDAARTTSKASPDTPDSP